MQLAHPVAPPTECRRARKEAHREASTLNGRGADQTNRLIERRRLNHQRSLTLSYQTNSTRQLFAKFGLEVRGAIADYAMEAAGVLPVLRLGFAVDCYKHSLEYKSKINLRSPTSPFIKHLSILRWKMMHEIIKRRALQVTAARITRLQ